jgi:hypothetical protein
MAGEVACGIAWRTMPGGDVRNGTEGARAGSHPSRRPATGVILADMPTIPLPSGPLRARARRTVLRATLTPMFLLLGSCRSPQADAFIVEQIRQIGEELNVARQQEAQLQADLDSLRTVVARQDTLLTRLAGMAGIPR